MRNHIRSTSVMLALATLAACSPSSESPTLSDDLKADLATVGGGDVQLAGMATPKLEFVTASERTESPTPAPKAAVSRAPSPARAKRAVAPSPRRETRAPAQAEVRAEDVAPADVPEVERAPEPAPAAAGRPSAPLPSTQREPAGGWSSPGRVIRNAPFPIKP